MKPLFTQDELKMFRTPGSVRRINGRLLQAQQAMRPLHFQNLTIHCQFLHIGPGIYNERWNTGGTHQHPDLQVEYALSGKIRFFMADRKFDLHAGQGLFIPPGMTHAWNPVEPSSMLGVLLELVGEDRETFIDRIRTVEEKGRGHLVSKKAQSLIQKIFHHLSRPRMPLCGIDEIAGLLDFLHIELIREQCGLMKWRPTAKPVETKDTERAKQLAERAMQFIEANHPHPVQLRDVALHTGVSNQHINRVFNAHYNTTINKALLRIRLEHAFRMLSEHSEYSIKAIAYDTGFSSAAYFTRCFGKAYGRSPLKVQGR